MKKVFHILSMAVIVLTAVSCGGNSDKGVVINGITWATRNTDANGKFVSSPEEIGFNGGFYSIPDSLFPKGWRLPTAAELAGLIKLPKQTIQRNGVQGHLYGVEPNAIFLPQDWGGFGATDGIYWSSTQDGGYIRTIHNSTNPDYLYSDDYYRDGCIRLVYDEVVNAKENVSKKEPVKEEPVVEKIYGGVYAVYGDTKESRQIIDTLDRSKGTLSGIAIKVNASDVVSGKDYWLVRALKYSKFDDKMESNWNEATQLAKNSKVAGGQATLGSVEHWKQLKKREKAINELARKVDADVFEKHYHWTSNTPREYGNGYQSAMHGAAFYIGDYDKYDIEHFDVATDMHVLLLSVFFK